MARYVDGRRRNMIFCLSRLSTLNYLNSRKWNAVKWFLRFTMPGDFRFVEDIYFAFFAVPAIMWAKEILFNAWYFFFDNSASSLVSAESATCRLFNGTIFRCGMKGNGAFDFRLQFHLFVSFSFVFSSFGKLSCGRPRLDHRQQSIGVIDKQKNREFEMEKGRTRSTKRSLHACCLFFSVECIALGRGANSLDGLYICKFLCRFVLFVFFCVVDFWTKLTFCLPVELISRY